MDVTPCYIEYIYDGESSYVSSLLSQIGRRLRETSDLISYVTSLRAMT